MHNVLVFFIHAWSISQMGLILCLLALSSYMLGLHMCQHI